MIDLNKIEAAAKSATPGPWECGEDADHEWYFTEQGNADSSIGWTVVNAEANATHIAASDPATVLGMVSMIRKRDAVLRQALSVFEERGHYSEEEAIAAIKEVLHEPTQP
mgnify:CR=1 FL=1